MAASRRAESRLHCIHQSLTVWGAHELDVDAFIRRGAIENPRPAALHPQLRAAVDAKIDEYMTTGRLTVS